MVGASAIATFLSELEQEKEAVRWEQKMEATLLHWEGMSVAAKAENQSRVAKKEEKAGATFSPYKEFEDVDWAWMV